MIYDAIKSLVVLIEKLAFFNKQLYGVYCILNTLTANYEYSRSNRENLPPPIQMQLSE